jgi:hypothetical protein
MFGNTGQFVNLIDSPFHRIIHVISSHVVQLALVGVAEAHWPARQVWEFSVQASYACQADVVIRLFIDSEISRVNCRLYCNNNQACRLH